MITYEFDYNVPFDNDAMGKGDFFLPVCAELMHTCQAIGPVVLVKIQEVYAVNLMRVINFQAAVAQMEMIAISYFSGRTSKEINVMRIAS